MFDTPLRNAKDRVATPIAQRMSNVSPAAITLIALVFGLLSALFAVQSMYLWGLVFWMINRALDGLDGLLARLHGKQGDFGGYLDILFDFVTYAAIPIGFVLGSPSEERYLTLAFMLGVFYVNSASWLYLAAILEKRNAGDPDTATTILMPAGLIGGFETFIAYFLFFLFPSYIIPLFLGFAILILITILQRLIWAHRELT